MGTLIGSQHIRSKQRRIYLNIIIKQSKKKETITPKEWSKINNILNEIERKYFDNKVNIYFDFIEK